MKVIALMMFKNEEWILPTYLSNVMPIVDEAIALDDASVDNSRVILEEAGVKVYDMFRKRKGEYHCSITPRNELLRLGREAGGTHFIILDADETFTTQFKNNARSLMSSMEANEVYTMQWLALWKSWDHYRDDESVWSNNYKDFIYCDDGKSDYSWDGFSTHQIGRVPRNSTQKFTQIKPEFGAVLHYQFSNFNAFQLKQVWYRVKELSLWGQEKLKRN